MQKKVFQAHIDQLHPMLIFIQSYAKSQNIPNEILENIILAAEEALVNVIHYSYPVQDSVNTIELICQPCDEKRPGIKITIQDKGVAFNPIERPFSPPSPPSPSIIDTEEVQIGGRGIYMYVTIMDRVEYKRVQEVNSLSLIKYLSY